ncbi:hypothetical protein IF1G_04878 [Cordyceps javanica]|uniref:Uncharacterized protein n=1 Tax=Cordyceps javanica TaxID=43265 RepID=A0A545V3K3_9HYPO|nr:hypothetical protein IF1G_04878 [Cordyceps javanica]
MQLESGCCLAVQMRPAELGIATQKSICRPPIFQLNIAGILPASLVMLHKFYSQIE